MERRLTSVFRWQAKRRAGKQQLLQLLRPSILFSHTHRDRRRRRVRLSQSVNAWLVKRESRHTLFTPLLVHDLRIEGEKKKNRVVVHPKPWILSSSSGPENRSPDNNANRVSLTLSVSVTDCESCECERSVCRRDSFSFRGKRRNQVKASEKSKELFVSVTQATGHTDTLFPCLVDVVFCCCC